MAVATVEFDTPHFLQSLFGHNLSLLKELENRFAVRVTTRDGWMRFEGSDRGVASSQKLFRRLEKARRNGVIIDAPVFRMLLKDSTTNIPESADPRSPDEQGAGPASDDPDRPDKSAGADPSDTPTATSRSKQPPKNGDEVVEDLRRLRLLAGSRKGGVVGRTPGQLAYLNAMAR